ncbi:heavy-metal-associated domain-containing protein [Nostoc sp. TCL26-01]|uniref:heavy-metal-associated domain-containing protein n=1 Tax=Nostoc sp. TCL26-01 TaxID=2576904 RepID=UPI0015BDB6D4|nr:heavy-metal-associated domain-containing protein [Nostoc sp. TCL26-01]QLE57392.1 heavy-metal-associated domain-containing protein [Nostoc sp. TCL26-01]
MALKLKIPNIVSDDCADKIIESVHVMEPDALVNVNVEDKTVIVESQASEESIKQVIMAAGYSIEGY